MRNSEEYFSISNLKLAFLGFDDHTLGVFSI